jgi:CARDB protein
LDPRDDDIEFDFFDDEPPTTEAQPGQRARLPRRGGGQGRGPRRTVRPPHGVTPLLRLLGLVIFVIALVLILILVLQSCAASSRHDSYSRYMDKVQKIAASSEANGRDVADALTTPGVKVAELESTLHGIAERERQNVQQAEDTNAPGRLRDENQHVVEALQLRVSGVDGLATTFGQTASSKATGVAQLLAQQADRLIASDVVWDDLFKDPAKAQLARDGVEGVSVPDSNFVTNRTLYSAESMSRVLQRLRGAATGGTPSGLHGTNIETVKALPSGKVLQSGVDNTITAGTDLQFAVTIKNSGDSQEVGVKITLTIDKPGNPIVRTQTVDFINPGQTVTKNFGDLGEVPFATKTTLKVDVSKVPGEKNTSNNSAQYQVIFSL